MIVQMKKKNVTLHTFWSTVLESAYLKSENNKHKTINNLIFLRYA